jgi:membrane protein implicated in regulation of membrane protease activity
LYTDRKKYPKTDKRRVAMGMPEEKKENKTWAIVGTIAAIVLCGLPGLCLLCPGGVAAIAGVFNNNSAGFDLPGWSGYVLLCLSVIFIAIAVVVPILLLRKKKPGAAAVEVLPPQEPLPPAS